MNQRILKVYLRRLEARSTTMPVPERARNKNLKRQCRVWLGATDQNGHGVIRVRPGDMGVPSGIVRVHRLGFWINKSNLPGKGPFPIACEIDHECRNKPCWEEEHLTNLGPREHSRISNEDRWKAVEDLKIK